jgi:hypothetical protein
MVKFVGAFLALLLVKMIKIEFLYGKAMDFHAKGLRLSDLLLEGYEVPPWFGVCIML